MISVIIPVYNNEQDIRRALDSVLHQTEQDVELVVVDDGSTDGSPLILDEYHQRYQSRIKVIHQPNMGVTRARLNGVAAATGEWIGFVDGDDEVEADMYALLLRNARIYDAQISHCGYQMIFADGRVNYFHNTGCLAEQDKTTGLLDLLDGSMVEPGLWNKLFHKTLFHSLLHDGSAMDTSIKINEDLLMNYILFSQADKSVFEDVCKYHYIVRNTSATRTQWDESKTYDPLRVRQKMMDMQIPGMEEATRKAYIGTCVNTYNGLMLNHPGETEQIRKNIYRLILERQAWIALLSRKQQLLARLILHCPRLYRPIYRFYARYVLKNPYQ